MDDQLRANLGRELLPHTFMGELRAALDAIAPIINAAIAEAVDLDREECGPELDRTMLHAIDGAVRDSLLAAADDQDAWADRKLTPAKRKLAYMLSTRLRARAASDDS